MSKELVVADVLTPLKLILNQGADDGIALGDKFMVYGLGKGVKDPSTGEELERLEIVRGVGKIVHLQKKISTLESTETHVVPRKYIKSGGPSLFSALYATEEIRMETETKPFAEPQIGDLLRKIPLIH